MDGVIPVTMEFVSADPQLNHFLVRDFDALLVGVLIQCGEKRQSEPQIQTGLIGLSRGKSDQSHCSGDHEKRGGAEADHG